MSAVLTPAGPSGPTVGNGSIQICMEVFHRPDAACPMPCIHAGLSWATQMPCFLKPLLLHIEQNLNPGFLHTPACDDSRQNMSRRIWRSGLGGLFNPLRPPMAWHTLDTKYGDTNLSRGWGAHPFPSLVIAGASPNSWNDLQPPRFLLNL